MKPLRRIVLVGRNPTGWAGFATGLAPGGEAEIIRVNSAAATLDFVQRQPVDLVVVGEALADMDPVACVTGLIRLDPMLTCAMVSALTAEDFQAATEGLGVLMQLPPDPSGQDAAALMARVEALMTLLNPDPAEGARS